MGKEGLFSIFQIIIVIFIDSLLFILFKSLTLSYYYIYLAKTRSQSALKIKSRRITYSEPSSRIESNIKIRRGSFSEIGQTTNGSVCILHIVDVMISQVDLHSANNILCLLHYRCI